MSNPIYIIAEIQGPGRRRAFAHPPHPLYFTGQRACFIGRLEGQRMWDGHLTDAWGMDGRPDPKERAFERFWICDFGFLIEAAPLRIMVVQSKINNPKSKINFTSRRLMQKQQGPPWRSRSVPRDL